MWPHTSKSTVCPLHPLQQEIYYDQILDDTSPHNNVGGYNIFYGLLDKTRLQEVLRKASTVFDVLRQRLHVVEGEPACLFLDEASDLPIHELDLSADINPREKARQWIQTYFNKAFDLSNDLLFENTLIKITADEHWLCYKTHHLLMDGYGSTIYHQYIATRYSALVTGKEEDLSDNYPSYQLEVGNALNYIGSASYQQDAAYWQTQFSNVPDLLLRKQYPQPRTGEKTSTTVVFDLTNAQRDLLATIGQKTATSLQQLTLAALIIYFGRTEQREEMAIGIPIHNRRNKQQRRTLGMFASTIPFRGSYQPDETLTDLLRRIRVQQRNDYRHQSYPISHLNRFLMISAQGRTNLFDVVVNYALLDFELQCPGLRTETYDVLSEHEKTPLHLWWRDFGPHQPLQLRVSYQPAYFTADEVNLLIKRLLFMLEQFDQQLESPVSALGLLPPAEKKMVHETFQADQQRPRHLELMDSNKLPHQLIEQQIDLTPDALAVSDQSQSLTYRQLDEQANQLAHFLRGRGIGPEQLVGICLHRSVKLVVSVLAVLKAGGAYLPLDPNYPADRLRFMLQDSDAVLLLTQQSIVSQLPPGRTPVVVWEEEASTISSQPSYRPNPFMSPENLVYVIYTSGSTGKPKGVMVTQGNLLSACRAWQLAYDLPASRNYLQLASFSFDVFTGDVFRALMGGSRLVLCPPDLMHQPDRLYALLVEERIDTTDCVPAVMRYLADYLEETNQTLSFMRTIVIGSDVWYWTDYQRFLALLGPTTILINAYGITETTIDNTFYRGSINELTHQDKRLPIGRPFSHTRLYVLDSDQQLVPIGVAGELYIGGPCVARGYLNRPDLTAQRFITHPQWGRLYRTGDQVRWQVTGELIYVGRIDGQIKIRGYRIEPGEIERTLQRIPGIEQAVVVAKSDDQGHKRLVGYVMTTEAFDTTQALLTLQQQIPAYMVPARLIQLETMPLTANGKVDRQALSVRTLPDTPSKQFTRQLSEAEAKLVTIWQELLGVIDLELTDNFFFLGGDSITAIQLVSRAGRVGLHFQPKDVFEQPTLAGLASRLATDHPLQAEQGQLTGLVAQLPIQHWFFEQNFANPSHDNQALLLEVSKAIPVDSLRQALVTLTAQHDALRVRFTNQSSYGDQVGDLIVTDLSQIPLSDVSDHVSQLCQHYQQSLDIQQGELVRWLYWQMPASDEYNRLFLVIHHLVVDGVSWRILLDDLVAAVDAQRAHRPLPLVLKTSSLRQWHQALRTYAATTAIHQREYWLTISQTPFTLPVDLPALRPCQSSQQTHSISLDRPLTQALLTTVHQAYHSQINDLLLTALAGTISNWTDQSAILIGLEGHGREPITPAIDLSRTVGWFTTLYPVVLSVHSSDSLGDRLVAIKEQLRQVPDNGLGYGLLRYSPSFLPQAVNVSPLPALSFELVFNYLGQLDSTLAGTDWLRMASESPGQTSSGQNAIPHKLTINAWVERGRLMIQFTYSGEQYQSATIEGLAEQYGQHLTELIQHCQQQTICQKTPSDYGLDGLLSYDELRQVLSQDYKGRPLSDQITDLYRLSPLQEGLLFHGLYDSTAANYVEQVTCRLAGLDVDRFLQCWQQLLVRHTILRTSYHYVGLSVPIQCVHRDASIPFQWVDHSRLAETEQQAAVHGIRQTDRQQAFIFDQAPLMRLTLVQLAENDYEFIWTSHHLVLDGWSTAVLLDELLGTYNEKKSLDAEQSVEEDSYGAYIHYLDRQDRLAARQFWQTYLQGLKTASLLPFIAPGVDRNKGGRVFNQWEWSLDLTLQTNLEQYIRQHHLTLNTVLQGAWGYLLSVYTGQSEVVFGVTVSDRPAQLIRPEQRVGLYINTLPMRVRASEPALVAEWLKQLQVEQSQARMYTYASLAGIQREQGLPGELFDTLLVVENYPASRFKSDSGALPVRDVRLHSEGNYPLTIVVLMGNPLTIRFVYRSDLLTHGIVVRIQRHLEEWLRQLTTRSRLSLTELSILPVSERQLLNDFQTPAQSYPLDKTLVHLFEEQATRQPDHLAVQSAEGSLTYHQLNERATQLAFLLLKRGIKAETLVPICMERCPSLLVGVLAILKAGGAYVPLDPAMPTERMEYMLADTEAQLILTNEAHKARIRPTTGRTILVVDAMNNAHTGEGEESSLPTCKPTQLAYVIYTSGSTGRPKGVMVEHRSVVNMAYASGQIGQLTKDSRSTMVFSVGFDATGHEWWSVLLTGASLHVVTDEQRLQPDELLTIYREQRITHSFLPTALAESVFSALPSDLLIQYILTGGDQLKSVATKHPFCRLINHYGPTENTVISTAYKLPRGVSYQLPPIGKPLTNTAAYVVDQQGRLVPVGVAGELYVGGVGVARGYWKQPALTAERFIPDCFSNHPGDRLYKTGDLVRWGADGQLEFLGRRDEQVKIRGYRIELGEVETVLRQCDGVGQAVVVVSDQQASKQLIGFVIMDNKADLNELRTQLRNRLPDYMVPARLIRIDQWPLTPNGKIDKKALLELIVTQEIPPTISQPENEIELTLLSIWQNMLQVEGIGVEDSFFELGGDSIRAMSLIGQLNQRFPQAAISVAHLFKYPTIRQLATSLETLHSETNDTHNPHLIRLQDKGRETPIFIVPGMVGVASAYCELATAFGDNQPVYCFTMLGTEPGETPLERIEAIASQNLIWLKSVQPKGPYKLIGHSFGGLVLFEMIRQLEAQGEAIRMAVLLDSAFRHSFSLKENDPALGLLSQQPGTFDLDCLQTNQTSDRLLTEPLLAHLSNNALFKERSMENQGDLLKRLLRVVLANERITYYPHSSSAQPILLIKAEETDWSAYDSSLGWHAYVTDLQIVSLAGDHYTMLKGLNAQLVVEQIRQLDIARQEQVV